MGKLKVLHKTIGDRKSTLGKVGSKLSKTEPTQPLLDRNSEIAVSITNEQKDLIKLWNEKKKIISSHSRFAVKKNSKGKDQFAIETTTNIGNEREKSDLFCAELCLSTGVRDVILAGKFILDTALASGLNDPGLEKVADNSNFVLDAIHALRPQDELEGMLVCRLVALHFQIMDFMGRTMKKDQSSPYIDLQVNRVSKLTRLYNETLETLMRYRRKGEQKVVVQHVNIANGGQAIVGTVLREGGGKHKTDEVPHGKADDM